MKKMKPGKLVLCYRDKSIQECIEGMLYSEVKMSAEAAVKEYDRIIKAMMGNKVKYIRRKKSADNQS